MQEAIKLFEYSSLIFSRLTGHSNFYSQKIFIKLVYLYLKVGNIFQAIQTLDKLLEIPFVEGNSQTEMIKSFHELGIILLNSYQFEKAIVMFKKAMYAN